MAGQLRLLLTTASVLAFFAGSSAGFAQTGRPWVDPPSPSGATPASPAPQPAAPPASPAPTSKAPEVQPDKAERLKENTQVKSASSTDDEEPAVKPRTKKKVATGRKSRSSTRQARNAKRETVTARRRGPSVAAQRRMDRYEAVREGIDSGLVVMSLRTIEYPDGRRVRVLTRPDPRTMSELMGNPY